MGDKDKDKDITLPPLPSFLLVEIYLIFRLWVLSRMRALSSRPKVLRSTWLAGEKDIFL